MLGGGALGAGGSAICFSEAALQRGAGGWDGETRSERMGLLNCGENYLVWNSHLMFT